LGRGVSSPLLRRTCVTGGKKEYHFAAERAVERIVSPVELRYEGPNVTKARVPGTLTHTRQFPTIEYSDRSNGNPLRNAGDTASTPGLVTR